MRYRNAMDLRGPASFEPGLYVLVCQSRSWCFPFAMRGGLFARYDAISPSGPIGWIGWQGNELGLAGDLRKATAAPVILRLFDPFLRTGDEIPIDVTRLWKRLPAHKH